MKSVSVCISVFGFSQYLEEQLRSIFVQSHKIKELVVVEDYSNSPSPYNFLSSLCSKYNVVLNYKLLSKNVGPAEAFRIACMRSSGDVVFFCDHDDIWRFDRVALALDKHRDYEMVVCNGFIFTDASDLASGTNLTKVYNSKPCSNCLKIIIRNVLVGATISVDGNLIRSLSGNFQFTPMHDWNLCAYFAMKNKPIAFIDDSLIMYRRHNATFTGRSNNSILKRIRFRLILLKFMWHVLCD